ncbi:hypothetical protein [Candidatus Venteria ishoeyi]|uniref:Uncharacterized protein n=1 Tax=Candidatus Venteria ishoeyi TaxID=1899563 RepID=A0A1H6FCM0_9GAMM|nr:hypothetical protein [Candidatus Venteria ishoeyi]MDM8547174.1 hypothetical protein [Candidatus Venteria ishoeyi]SEH07820.1 Uncharacterised protein [Candidatus Venteria ishoeyi]SEH07830.1 Uncharacterised protein [Candidatus Venteria ishoeyi]
MQSVLDEFLGLWLDKNGNLLFIKPWNTGGVKVSFASGKTKAPVERGFMQQQLTIDVPGEFHEGFGELIVQFGPPYYGPQLHLRHEITDIYEGKPSLEPSHALVASAPKEKKEWLQWLEPLDDYVLVDDDRKEAVLSSYQLSST